MLSFSIAACSTLLPPFLPIAPAVLAFFDLPSPSVPLPASSAPLDAPVFLLVAGRFRLGAVEGLSVDGRALGRAEAVESVDLRGCFLPFFAFVGAANSSPEDCREKKGG